MKSVALAIVIVVALQGCVVYPTQRTYFEPNAMDGVPTPSRGCGYQAARNDALVRNVEGLHIQVSPHLDLGKPVSVTVLFRAGSKAVISPEKYELRSQGDGSTYRPVSSKINMYGPDKTHPYYSSWVTLQFQQLPEELSDIAIVFPLGTVSLGGQAVELAPFRFHKTTKNDIYYGSINC